MATSERRHLTIAAPTESENGKEHREISDTLLQVGDLAKSTGKTVRAIHLYEDLGLLEPARRSKGHYRLFSSAAQTRVRWIGKMQSLGLSLSEIQALVEQRSSSESAQRAALELRRTYQAKLDEVKDKIAALQALEAELQASLEYLDECNVSCEQTVTTQCCASCNRHHETPTQPELVAGAYLE
jgi:DNA-binding transcriptional MerR regulator